MKLDKALEKLRNSQVVAIPTETVYGLAGSIASEEAIKKIFATKERPFFDPLIVHVCDIPMARTCVHAWPQIAEILAKEFWPGPLTFILPKAEHINSQITSGLDTVGIRCPNHPLTLELIRTFNTPLAAPSANKFKKISPTSAEHVRSEFNDVYVLDGGVCEVGIESTIIGIDENKINIYRPGMITKEMISEVLSRQQLKVSINYQESPVAPGHLKHHYQPKKPVFLRFTTDSDRGWRLPSNPVIAARDLYAKLRELDQTQSALIEVLIDPKMLEDENFKGILNRLEKAAQNSLVK